MDNKLKSKLEKQRETILSRYDVVDKIEGGELIIEFVRKGEIKAKIVIDVIDSNTYIVESSWSKVKGLGKFLYLEAANLIYPKCLVPDKEDVSEDAKKVWNLLTDNNQLKFTYT